MSDATTKEVLDKLSLILLLSKISLHNYYSILAIQSCNLIWKQVNMQVGKLGIEVWFKGWLAWLGNVKIVFIFIFG
jgi:hypothetical protein